MAVEAKQARPVMNILLVEDNPGDIELTKEAFTRTKLDNHLHIVRNGEEALEFLYRNGKHANAVRPDLILLDLNMPRTSGKEVLSIIKEDESLRDIPVIVLTSSEAEQDIATSYNLHANAYIVKPMELDQFLHVADIVGNFWLDIARLPPAMKLPEAAKLKPSTPTPR